MTSRCLLVLFALAPLVTAAPVPKDDDADKLRASYGTWTDRDKDCKYALKGGELRISIPATTHLLASEREESKDNAPRVLREVKGDFTATVRVTFPVPERIPQGYNPHCSGGLVAWESDKAHMVIRRSGGHIGVGGRRPESIWSCHVTPSVMTHSGKEIGKPAGSAFLRLKREGNRVIVGWSRDGKAWKESEPVDVAWGAKVKVGVAAENCLGTPVEITFDEYSLTQPKK